MRRSTLTPRGGTGTFEDLASRGRLMSGQRVDRARLRRRVARRARRVAGRAGLFALGLGALGVIALLAGWLAASPRFSVASVEVSGQSRLSRETIEETAGIAPGTNIFALNTRDIAARLEALPLVRHASVVRTLPNRVAIVVEERRPFTLVHAAKLHWLDEDGRVLGDETRAVNTEVPVISGLSEEELVTMRTSPGPRARAAIALIRALLRTGSALASEISEIDMSRAEGPVLYTVDGVEVRLGTEEWDERLARLEGVLAQVARQDVNGVDLRFRDQVVLRRSK